MALIVHIGPIPVEPSQLELWRDGSLGPEWMRRFEAKWPLYFDADFRWYYEHQGMRVFNPDGTVKSNGGYGFYETLAGIVLFHATGYLPLATTHDFQFPSAKDEIVRRLPAQVPKVIRDRNENATQAPDLLMYTADHKDWFFCDAKGPHDTLRKKQREKFEAIARASDKPVRILHFKWAPRGS